MAAAIGATTGCAGHYSRARGLLPYFTLGGLDTLPTGEVVNAQRETIPGLYAAGRTACGVVRRAEGYSSGMSVGDATYSGRLAGLQAAAKEH